MNKLAELEKALDEHAIVSATDALGNIIYVNQKFIEISGYSASELIGFNHRILKSGLHSPFFYHEMWNTLLLGKTWQGEVCNERKNGEIYWVRASIRPVLDEKGLPFQFISIRTDITDIKLAEARLTELNTELDSYRKKSEFELNIARELIDHMILQASKNITNAGVWHQEATNLSGDLILIQDDKNERDYLLVADAMEHGLPAALPLIPIVQIFTAMTTEGFTIPAIVREMNSKINWILSTGNFVALTLVSIDYANQLIEVWNGGNPVVRCINSKGFVIKEFPSHHLALGILKDSEFDSSTKYFHWEEDCWLMAHSDGLVEVENASGSIFGEKRVQDAISNTSPHNSLKNSVLKFLDGCKNNDDISLATIFLPNDSKRHEKSN